jgi:hypothetical protein
MRDDAGEGPEFVFRYSGGSMWPLFRDDDVLIARRVDPKALRVGDVVVYRDRGRDADIVHRVVALTPGIITRGDHRKREDDAPVPPEGIRGRVAVLLRDGRRRAVLGGIAGRAQGRLMQLASRLDPCSPARLGRLARAIQRALAPLAAHRVRGASLVVRARPDGRPGKRLVLRGKEIAEWDESAGAWRAPWPCSLWISPRLLSEQRGIEGK